MSSAHDFDFLHGDWAVRHRRPKRRLANDDTWDEFDGACRVRPILEGVGNFDENVIHLPAGRYEACTLRLFRDGLWSIHWIDGRAMQLDAAMKGRFQDGVGLFLANETFEGRPVVARFLWRRLAPEHARWEQALSADGGASWETNWVMDFRRAVRP